MAWMKNGDNAATYPPLMSTAGMPEADERIVNEVGGFVWRAATQSAAHSTDYLVDMGTLFMLGGSRTQLLLSMCERAGLMTKVEQAGIVAYQITADPEFIHIRLRAEIEWERQQRNDTRNTGLIIPVRRRDGDSCRWCGVLVQWLGRGDSGRRGEYDHKTPGERGTVETMYVACRTCNGSRGANVEAWDSSHTLRPAPARPLYGRASATLLQKNGYPDIQANIVSDEEPKRVGEVTAAPSEQRQTSQPPQQAPLGATIKPPEPVPKVDVKDFKVDLKSLSCSDGTSSAGSGRDGSGQVGLGTGLSGLGLSGSPGGTTWPDGSTASNSGSSAGTGGRRRRRGRRGSGK